MSSKLYSNYFSEALELVKTKAGGITGARVSDDYKALQRELVKVHSDEQSAIDSRQVAELKSLELKARMELLKEHRARGAPAPTGMVHTQLVNEYLSLLHAHFEDSFELFLFKDVDGKMVVDDGTRDELKVDENGAAAPNQVVEAMKELLGPLMKRLDKLEAAGKPLPNPAASGHARRGAATRAVRFADALDRAGEKAFGLPPNDQVTLATFIGRNDPVPHSHARTLHGSRSAMSGQHGESDALLFPSTFGGSANIAQAAELVQSAVRQHSTKAKFGSYKQFKRTFNRVMRALVDEDPAKFLQYYKHEENVVTLALERSWEAAEAYHWDTFARVADGEFSFEQGSIDLETWCAVIEKFPRKKAGKDKKGKKTFKCTWHGVDCSHPSSSCTLNPKNGGDGKRAATYKSG